MGRLFAVNLEGKIYTCRHCRTHLALSEDVISKVSTLPLKKKKKIQFLPFVWVFVFFVLGCCILSWICWYLLMLYFN